MNWVREYKKENNIVSDGRIKFRSLTNSSKDIDELSSMSKEELIDEVIKARIGEERTKKDTGERW